jgi:sugar/nucleoside kinase (ribokinase family)
VTDSRPSSDRVGVACAGSVVVDVGKVIDAYPAIEQLAMIEEISQSTGGPGLNLGVDLRQLGADFPIILLGAVGDDDHGRFVLDECHRLGIDVSRVTIAPAGVATAFTDAMVERDGGRRTFFHHIGSNATLDLADVDPGTLPTRILHAGAPGIHRLLDAPTPDGGNGWSRLLGRARAAGLWTNLELVPLDPRRNHAVALPCLPELDSIVINELEAGALTGIEAPVPGVDGPVDWPALEAMAQGLLGLGVHRLAVVHFPAGSVAATPDGQLWRQGSVRVPAEQVRSTTGAGDAFAAGVILGVHDGLPVRDCLRLGAASAAACVRSPHTSSGIMTADRCLAAADAAGYRPTAGPDAR